MNIYEIVVKDKGELPHCSFPGGYPIIYVTKASEAYCSECASKRPEIIEIDDCHMEGPPIICQDCDKEIESAYGDPEDNEKEV